MWRVVTATTENGGLGALIFFAKPPYCIPPKFEKKHQILAVCNSSLFQKRFAIASRSHTSHHASHLFYRWGCATSHVKSLVSWVFLRKEESSRCCLCPKSRIYCSEARSRFAAGKFPRCILRLSVAFRRLLGATAQTTGAISFFSYIF